jgi:2-amino-4-hydroxy-6-hydroxymethyldihydropteridine diphosphokinase
VGVPEPVAAQAVSQVYVALGSNLGNRQQHVRDALVALHVLVDKEPSNSSLNAGTALASQRELVRCSPWYETDPMGPPDQPPYINAVCTFGTRLMPLDLLTELQRIEKDHGRQRTATRWTARPLDLDLLLYGEQSINTAVLTVPHPGIAERSFVLLPLADLSPGLAVPGVGTVEELLTRCQQFGIRRLHFSDDASIHSS